MPAAKKKKPKDDYTFAYMAGILVAGLVVGFVAAWAYYKPFQQQLRADVAFAAVGPFHIENQGYTFNASLAIQTDSDNGRWAKKNKDALNDLLYRTLLDTDPKTLSTPAGLVSTQQVLTQTINQSFDRPRVQQVLFTDFVLQAD
ncbi:MAG TPA: flagellar basal body-associated FliL family protein [Paucimonas sp.]|nr:flagellar basal body-associated FliL family protein [Paucimonas sp.]